MGSSALYIFLGLEEDSDEESEELLLLGFLLTQLALFLLEDTCFECFTSTFDCLLR